MKRFPLRDTMGRFVYGLMKIPTWKQNAVLITRVAESGFGGRCRLESWDIFDVRDRQAVERRRTILQLLYDKMGHDAFALQTPRHL